jgi:hypothetical protein
MYRIKPSVMSILAVVALSVAVGGGTANAAITSIDPPNGSTLTGASQTFSWTGTGITEWWLYVGTTKGARDILNSGSLGTALSTTVNGLPTDGSTIYVRLWHKEGSWLFTDYTYTAFTTGSGGLSAFPPWSQNIPGAERFVLVLGTTANPDGEAVLDKETGLVWERSPDTGIRNWIDAISHCAVREVGGRKGWELPLRNQLASLVDSSNSNPALPTGHPFLTVQSETFYWAATADAGNPAGAWIVRFDSGGVSVFPKDVGIEHAWCVRGGQAFDGNVARAAP